MLIIRRVFTAIVCFLPALLAPAVFAEKLVSLEMDIATRQPANAPVIFEARLTNTTADGIQDNFDWPLPYSATLTGPDGVKRKVAVTNGAQTEGSFPADPILEPNKSVTTPLRLTNYDGSNARRHVPSEQVYLPPGKYRLDLTWVRPGYEQRVRLTGNATATFEVIRNETLRKARFTELQRMRDNGSPFARHVLEHTLTPELRQQWYQEIEDVDPNIAAFRVYTLSTIRDAPPDVMPAIVEIVKHFSRHPEPDNRNVNHILNNGVYAILEHRPPGARSALLTVATRPFASSSRTPAIQALKYYFQGDMVEPLLPLLQENDKWVPIYTARLLAWAGNDAGADLLIAAAKQNNVLAAASLAYLPNHAISAQTLEQSLASSDAEFVGRLKKSIAQQAPSRATTPVHTPAGN